MKLLKMMSAILLVGTLSIGISCTTDSTQNKEAAEEESLNPEKDRDLLSMEMKMDSLSMDSLEMEDYDLDEEEEGTSDDDMNEE